MEIRKSVVMAGATFAAVLALVLLSGGNEPHAPVKPAAEPDLFPFLKPMDAAANDGKAAEPPHAGKHREDTQPMPAPAASAAPLARGSATTPADLARVELEVQRMRSEGLGEDEIYRKRALSLSPEAAAQLAQAEQEENRWKARIELYLAERARLLAMNGNTPGPAAQETLQQLRNSFFSAEEQERLASYEPQASPQLTLN